MELKYFITNIDKFNPAICSPSRRLIPRSDNFSMALLMTIRPKNSNNSSNDDCLVAVLHGMYVCHRQRLWTRCLTSPYNETLTRKRERERGVDFIALQRHDRVVIKKVHIFGFVGSKIWTLY